MDDSDDEDPLALLPKARSRKKSKLSITFNDAQVSISPAAPSETVPTSDWEEAHEESIRSKGWEVYLRSRSEPWNRITVGKRAESSVRTEAVEALFESLPDTPFAHAHSLIVDSLTRPSDGDPAGSRHTETIELFIPDNNMVDGLSEEICHEVTGLPVDGITTLGRNIPPSPGGTIEERTKSPSCHLGELSPRLEIDSSGFISTSPKELLDAAPPGIDSSIMTGHAESTKPSDDNGSTNADQFTLPSDAAVDSITTEVSQDNADREAAHDIWMAPEGDLNVDPQLDTIMVDMVTDSTDIFQSVSISARVSPIRGVTDGPSGSPIRPSGSLPRARTRSPSLTPAPATPPDHRLSPRPAGFVPTLETIPQDPPELDPALLAFQNARTFRTRTAIQLQPYTREKTKYRAMVRKGGRLLIAELLHDDPDRAVLASSLQEATDSQFRGEEEVPEEPEIDMTVSPLVSPSDQDYADHFQFYGEVADEASDPRLQELAKTRIKRERLEVRRKAREEKQAQQYMAFVEREIKERERLARSEEKEEKRKLRAEKARQREDAAKNREAAQAARAGRPVPRQRANKRPTLQEDSPELEDDVQPISKRRRLVRRAQSSESGMSDQNNGYEEKFENRMTSTQREAEASNAGLDDGSVWDGFANSFDNGGFISMRNDMVDSTFSSPPDPPIPISSSRTIHAATPLSVTSLGSSSSSNSNGEEDGPREKVKALKRVMPALLAKRLADKAEADYQARQRRKALKDKEIEDSLRIRPGQAVRRKTKGPSLRQGVEGLFDDDPALTGEDETPHYALAEPPDPMIVVFSSSEGEEATEGESDTGQSSDASQYRHERQRQFQAGDFASLLHGLHKTRDSMLLAKTRSTTLFRRSRAGMGSKRMNQARRPPQNAASVRNAVQPTKAYAKRPRIKRKVLDDQTIFELEPNAGTRTRPVPHSSPKDPSVEKRTFARTSLALTNTKLAARNSASPARSGIRNEQEILQAISPSRPIPIPEVSDMWDELQDFQIDFAIKPLHTGVEFSPTSFVGAGKLQRYISALNNECRLSHEAGIDAMGLSFEPSMEPAAFIAILPIAFDKVRDEVLHVMNDRLDPSASPAPDAVSFIVSYIANGVWNDGDLRQVQMAIQSFGIQLKESPVPRTAKNRSQAFFLLKIKLYLAIAWMILSQADSKLEMPTAYDYEASVVQQLTEVLEGLLRYGFDRTMKPLKAIMNFEAEDGIIDDFSAECWVSVLHLAECWEANVASGIREFSTIHHCIDQALDRAFEGRHIGPRASERIWYLTLGLTALSQFDPSGKVPPNLSVSTRWHLVRKALNAVKISSYTEEEEVRKRHQLKPRDKYIKIMVIRCLQLTSVWRWHCDRESFNIATKDLGAVFRERALRGLPNETYADFPVFIRRFNRTLAEEIDMEESAYNLYLQLVCLCASDIVTIPPDLNEAKRAAADVKRLMLSIVPFSPVRFREGKVPTDRQLSALINRFSTAIIAAIFDITLLPFLLGNTRKWIDFASADIESRRTCIRGLMYLGVAARHHGESLSGIVEELSRHFETIQRAKSRLEATHGGGNAILEHGRLLVLIVSCFKTLINTQSFDDNVETGRKFPDPELLAPCWTQRLRSTELVVDRRAGLEVVACVQSFLDARASALPARSKRKRIVPDGSTEESQQSEYSAMGLDFTDADLLAIDEAGAVIAPEAYLDAKVAPIIADSISPGIYALLSNTMTGSWQQQSSVQTQADRQLYISALTRCWAECASVLVVDHHLRDWDTYLAYGQESWERLGDEVGKRQVGMNFMLNVAQLDPPVVSIFSETFVLLLLQALVAHQFTIEPTFVSTVLLDLSNQGHYLFKEAWSNASQPLDRAGYSENRLPILKRFFNNANTALRAGNTAASSKAFVYRCVNYILATMQQNYSLISLRKGSQRSAYRSFSNEVVRALREESQGSISELSVPKIKQFPLPEPVHTTDGLVVL